MHLIRFIKRAQELGFSLGDIGELLALRVGPGTTAAEMRGKSAAQARGVAGLFQGWIKMG